MHETFSCTMKELEIKSRETLVDRRSSSGWVLTHTTLYESEVYYEKCFILLYMFQRHFEWCKVEHNETIYFLYWNLRFFLFWKKKRLSIESKLFFWVKGNFLILTSKVWNRFEKMHSTSKIFPHNFKSFIGHFKEIEKHK